MDRGDWQVIVYGIITNTYIQKAILILNTKIILMRKTCQPGNVSSLYKGVLVTRPPHYIVGKSQGKGPRGGPGRERLFSK